MKLNSLVQATNDPDLLEYAFTNLGRGVSNRACFSATLSTLRQKWLYWLAMRRTPIFLDLYERQIATSLFQLSSISVSVREIRADDEITLRKKLKDRNLLLRIFALETIARRRCHVEPELIDCLKEPYPAIQEAAHRALVFVARGTDFGPIPGASQRTIERSIEKWKAWYALQEGASSEMLAKDTAAAAKKRTKLAPLEAVPLILVNEESKSPDGATKKNEEQGKKQQQGQK